MDMDVPDLTTQGVTVDIVDYLDKKALVDALEGVDTVLSFIVTINDPDNRAQKTLIDACIEAGVLVFTLFQCGLFLNYFTYLHPSAKFMHIFPMPIDVKNCKAIIHKDTKAQITLTSVQDLARVVSKAVDYQNAWPEVSGVRANQVSVLDFIGLCEKTRGQSFIVESVQKSDLEKGMFTSSRFSVIAHPAVPEDHRDAFSQSYFSAFILALERGGWDASNEWNELLPNFRFTCAEEFLSDVWKHGPINRLASVLSRNLKTLKADFSLDLNYETVASQFRTLEAPCLRLSSEHYNAEFLNQICKPDARRIDSAP
ncbi:hypothetical protein BPAE_0045g00100 [Botrytis paeoniae]|uniref:Uncharacterized protein n=1 Tax=Botrytis paeoniae TaxID=278948 RepID=A0A4Z1FYJ5_9HELO|nr:hypothetical protein BPAE_0045g00100 [Botrytis paeoniae]